MSDDLLRRISYRTAAPVYLRTGWSPIPLPAKRKKTPPKEFTGADGLWVDEKQFNKWNKPGQTVCIKYTAYEDNGQEVEKEWWFEPGNLAIRLPKMVIGLDVDTYDGKQGAETFAKAVAAWGELPPTWMTTSKKLGTGSGIRLYRVPEGLSWPGDLRGQFGHGVELIRWDHRYAIAFPSIHDKTGEQYRWINPEGEEDFTNPPRPEDLPMLPAKWVDGLTGGKPWEYRPQVDMSTEESRDWVAERNNDCTCTCMKRTLDKWLGRMESAAREGGLHEAFSGGIWAVSHDAASGHSGVAKAIKKLLKSFMTLAVNRESRDGRRTENGARHEAYRIINGGITKAAASGEPDTDDPCLLVERMKDSKGNVVSGAVGARPAGRVRARKVQLFNEADDIPIIGELLRGGIIPETYVRRGEMVRVRRVVDEAGAVRLLAQPMTAASLREELSRHAEFFREKDQGRGEDKTTVQVPVIPSPSVCDAVLSSLEWEPLPQLRGVVSQPIFRPDGTLIQTPGYDFATGLYYEPEREVPPVDPDPSMLQVAAAKVWLMDTFLADFPWKGDADRANYLALLMTPVLRSYLVGVLSPFGVVTATSPGSGKSLLAEEIPSRLFRSSSHAWPRREEERQKVITTAFAEDSAVVVFDNIGDTDKLDSPALAKLLTGRTWSDRRLGKNDEMLSFLNNRLWMATGNNLALGGDMASRSVLVNLTPEGDPAKRRGFALGDLLRWLGVEANVDMLRRALLLLAIDWIRAGAPRIEFAMRNFSAWAEALGGFLKHHGILGFMDNEDDVKAADVEADDWVIFLAAIRKEAAGKALTAAEIHQRFAWDVSGDTVIPAKADGTMPTAQSLGMMMRRRNGRFFGGLTLVREDAKDHKAAYRVVTADEFREVVAPRQGSAEK